MWLGKEIVGTIRFGGTQARAISRRLFGQTGRFLSARRAKAPKPCGEQEGSSRTRWNR